MTTPPPPASPRRARSLLVALIALVALTGCEADAPATPPMDAGFDAGAMEGGRPRRGPGRILPDEVFEYDWSCTGEVAPSNTPLPTDAVPDDCTTGIWPDLDALTQVCPTPPSASQIDPTSGREVPIPGDTRTSPVEIPVAEAGSFAPATRPTSFPRTLKVVAWNVEYTRKLDGQITTLTTHPDLRDADVYLLGEVDRCSRRNGVRRAARLLAQALEADYAYGIEFVELSIDREVGGDTGQAIVSRRPLSGLAQLCHTGSYDWLGTSDEPRLGQRTALHGDIPVGDTSVRVFSIHFENNDALGELRTTQLRETLDAAQRLACERPSIVAGDFNTWYDTAPELYVAERAGYVDAVKVAGDTEPTRGGLRLDYLFSRGFRVRAGGVVRGLDQSDHDPVWATLELE
jgi:endonuclease/exonuclease/phosphatase family metal-dependent hydrolase